MCRWLGLVRILGEMWVMGLIGGISLRQARGLLALCEAIIPRAKIVRVKDTCC